MGLRGEERRKVKWREGVNLDRNEVWELVFPGRVTHSIQTGTLLPHFLTLLFILYSEQKFLDA